MPEISRFFGIVVAMFYSDHAPPHFHACYGEDEVTVRIDDGGVDGYFPRRALSSPAIHDQTPRCSRPPAGLRIKAYALASWAIGSMP